MKPPRHLQALEAKELISRLPRKSLRDPLSWRLSAAGMEIFAGLSGGWRRGEGVIPSKPGPTPTKGRQHDDRSASLRRPSNCL
jgi:hypothetical protein